MTTTTPAQHAGTVSLAGHDVPRMAYGTMGLGRAAQTGAITREAGTALLNRALELGVKVFDTAQFYGAGTANELLQQAFGHRRDQVTYVSKVGARVSDQGPTPVTAAQQPHELREQVEANLRSLGTDHLDVVYLRRMDQGPGIIVSDPEQKVALDDQLAELIALRDAGTIGAIGMSHVSLEQVEQALPAGVASISNIYNVLDRRDEPLLRLAEQHQAVWCPYFPLGGAGRGDHAKVTDHPVIRDIAEAVGASPSQVGLAWLLAHSPQTLVIAGTTSVTHLEENVAAASVELPPELLRQLDTLAA